MAAVRHGVARLTNRQNGNRYLRTKNMKTKIQLLAFCLLPLWANCQQIAKTVIAEHFTNTYCSICASRNPGLFNTLSNYPQVIHLAYYPSSPYAACPLSRHNPAENDARTNYYGIYGATPKLVVGGALITGPFTDTSIFSAPLSLTTSFAMQVTCMRAGADSITTQIKIKKVDTSSLTSLQLFGCVAEDTLVFAAQNGEPANYDVFRKALWGTSSLSVTAPASVGDSMVYSKTIATNTAWNVSRIYAVAILQTNSRQVVQASKSARLGVPAAVNEVTQQQPITLFPNPCNEVLYLGKPAEGAVLQVYNSAGAAIDLLAVNNGASLNVSSLKPGIYFLVATINGVATRSSFIKQ
ncbi:MAG: T9SS C-terminal target domain-containing protein [Chitinophagia bacterium]|nr:T9SS C-terminal target domain-containing protein [Chitinophagia bacterium]